MTTIITRVYASESQARAAVTALKAKNYSADRIATDSKSVKGKTVVTFRAEFGTARAVAKILDAHKPVSGSEATEEGPKGRGSVGLSAFLDIPELFRHNTRTELVNSPTPLSSFFATPVLSNKKPTVKLIDDPTPLSRAFNLPLLSDKKPDVKLLDWKPDNHLLIKR